MNDYTFGEMVMRTIWLILIAAFVLIAARLMAWADTGSRGECPVEQSIIPSEWRK
jgi:hypothetical protein